jgi:threonine-phosphate decarboxylase
MSENHQIHGSIPFKELRHLGINPSDIIDFSATVNPFPIPENIAQLINSKDIASYPDIDCYDAVKSIAEFYNIPVQWVAVTAGMTEVIYNLPRIFKKGILFSPSYSDYSDAYQRYGSKLDSIDFPDSEYKYQQTLNLLKSNRFDLIIICNPNNPNGFYLPIRFITELSECLKDSVICIDESYQEMGENCDSILPKIKNHENIIVLKSLTKPFGIGGLRAAYAVSSGKILQEIRNVLIPWGVSSISLRLIPAIFDNWSIFSSQWNLLHSEKKRIIKAIELLGINAIDNVCPFFLTEFEDPGNLRKHLLQSHHIAIRDCSSFGYDNLIRIMPSLPENNDKLIKIFSCLILLRYDKSC